MTALAVLSVHTIPESVIVFLRRKKRRIDEALAKLRVGEIDEKALMRAGIPRQELQQLAFHENVRLLTTRLNNRWDEDRALMRECFDPVQVDRLFNTLK